MAFALGHEFHADLLAGLYRAAACARPGARAERHHGRPRRARGDGRSPRAALRRAPPARARDVGGRARRARRRPCPPWWSRGPRAAVGSTSSGPTTSPVRRWLRSTSSTSGTRGWSTSTAAAAAGAEERRRGFRADRRTSGGRARSDANGAVSPRTTAPSPPNACWRVPTGPRGSPVFNDQSAAGLMDVLQQAGLRWPEDLSLVGYDDSPLARTRWARLTTVRQDVDALARLAVLRAVERVDDPGVAGGGGPGPSQPRAQGQHRSTGLRAAPPAVSPCPSRRAPGPRPGG